MLALSLNAYMSESVAFFSGKRDLKGGLPRVDVATAAAFSAMVKEQDLASVQGIRVDSDLGGRDC